MLRLPCSSKAQGCRTFAGVGLRTPRTPSKASKVSAQAEPKGQDVAQPSPEMENPESEMNRKAKEVEELRAQEKFMKVGTGEADCLSCGYHYEPSKGDAEFPVAPGTKFQDLPQGWACPVCSAEPKTFQVIETEVAGFAVNQGYGLGTNSMTAGQKSLLIYGSLAVFFALFLLGYFLE